MKTLFYFVWTRHGKKMYRFDGDVVISNGFAKFTEKGELIRADIYILFDADTMPPTLMQWPTGRRGEFYVSPKFLKRMPEHYIDGLGDIRRLRDHTLVMRTGGSPSGDTQDEAVPVHHTWRVTP